MKTLQLIVTISIFSLNGLSQAKTDFKHSENKTNTQKVYFQKQSTNKIKKSSKLKMIYIPQLTDSCYGGGVAKRLTFN